MRQEDRPGQDLSANRPASKEREKVGLRELKNEQCPGGPTEQGLGQEAGGEAEEARLAP